MLTKKFMIEAAAIIHNHKKNGATDKQVRLLIDSFSTLFRNDNPKFSQDRFDLACLTGKVTAR
jgi:hypothetical protein